MRRKENGAVLKRARKDAGLSQGELAFLVDCSHTTIYLLEKAGPRGLDTCSEELGRQIARRLHRPVDDLWEVREGTRPRSTARRLTTGKPAARGAA
jgi:DNA-binding XRE family transcriptional regulator